MPTGRGGLWAALQHIEDARKLSVELGGTDSDVKAYLYGLEGKALSSVLDEYGRRYGRRKRQYAEDTLPEWISGRTKMSGIVAERLFSVLPPRMPLETKYEMVRTLWEKHSPRWHGCFVIGPDCDPTVSSSEIERQLLRGVADSRIPDPLAKRFDWLSSGDVEARQELLNHFLGEERELILSDARTRSQIFRDHFRQEGRWDGRMMQEYRIGNHTLELFFDPRATGIREGRPDPLPHDADLETQSLTEPNANRSVSVVTLLCVIVAAVILIKLWIRSGQQPPSLPPNVSPSNLTKSTIDSPGMGIDSVPKESKKAEGVYRIVVDLDLGIYGHSRRAIKVVLGSQVADATKLRSTLLEIAKKQDADTVLIYGYLQGEDVEKDWPAGMLEYGRSGRGWGANSILPSGEMFKVRKSGFGGTTGSSMVMVPYMPPADSENLAGLLPAKNSLDRNIGQAGDDPALKLMVEQLHVFEPRNASMGELERAKLALRDLANSLNISETKVMEMSSVQRQDAMFRYISRKYGSSESELRRVWFRCFKSIEQVPIERPGSGPMQYSKP